MRLSTLATVLLGSSLTTALVPRQDTTSSNSVTSTTESSSSSSATSTSTTAAETTTASSTSASVSSTGSSTSTSSGASSTNLPNGLASCSEDQAKTAFADGKWSGPIALCDIAGGNNLTVGDNKFVTWWTGAFPSDSNIVVHFDWTDDSGKTQWNSSDTPNNKGFIPISITSDWLNGGSSSVFRLILEERGNDSGATVTGPIVTVTPVNTTPTPPAHTSFNFLGLAIGLPVALAVIAIILCVWFFTMRQNKGFLGKIRLPTRRKGYGVRQSRRQRMGATDDYDFDASAPIYRDEPAADYAASSRDERSARAMGVFAAKQNSTY